MIFYLLIVIPGFDSDEQAEKLLFSLNANMMAVKNDYEVVMTIIHVLWKENRIILYRIGYFTNDF